MILCPHCHQENKATARFCNECGTALEPIQPPLPTATRATSAVTSPLEPVLAVHVAPQADETPATARWRNTATRAPAPPASSSAIASYALPTAQVEAVETLPPPSFLITNQLTVPRATEQPSPPIPQEKLPTPEPFLERKPVIKPARKTEPPAPGAQPSPTVSVVRYGWFGATLALLLVAIGAVVLFSKLKTTSAPPIAHVSTKPAVASARVIEELPHPDLTNGKGVTTPPTAAPPHHQASQPFATSPKGPSESTPQAKPVEHKQPSTPDKQDKPSKSTAETPPALQDAETCLKQKKYDCAIDSARAANKQAPNNNEARRVLEKAKAARQQALESINIE